MKIINLNFTEVSNNYKEVLDFLIPHCNSFSLIITRYFYIKKCEIQNLEEFMRRIKDEFPNTFKLYEKLSPFLINSELTNNWPGTRTLETETFFIKYKFSEESKKILNEFASAFFDWQYPNLPEDLSFYRDADPFFITITHEEDAYFEIRENEFDLLKRLENSFKIISTKTI